MRPVVAVRLTSRTRAHALCVGAAARRCPCRRCPLFLLLALTWRCRCLQPALFLRGPGPPPPTRTAGWSSRSDARMARQRASFYAPAPPHADSSARRTPAWATTARVSTASERKGKQVRSAVPCRYARVARRNAPHDKTLWEGPKSRSSSSQHQERAKRAHHRARRATPSRASKGTGFPETTGTPRSPASPTPSTPRWFRESRAPWNCASSTA